MPDEFAAQPITHLVLNWFKIEEKSILVGATDNERWRWDIEDGMSGADAKTIVSIELAIDHETRAVSETAEFFCRAQDPVRHIAMSNLSELFDIAWIIKNEKLTIKAAKERFFGMKVNTNFKH